MPPPKTDPAALARYLREIAKRLPTEHHRQQLAIYAEGLLSDLPRKSCEPIAAAGATCHLDAERRHGSLLYFLRDAVWDDEALRRSAERASLNRLASRGDVTSWHIEEIGIVKKGDRSVGVASQLVQEAAETQNCQLLVALGVGTVSEIVPVDLALYLPAAWLADDERRRARIPDSRRYLTRVELAIQLLAEAHARKLPGRTVFAPMTYGASSVFRAHVRGIGEDLVCPVPGSMAAALRGPRGWASTVKTIASSLPDRAFHSYKHRGGVERTNRFALAESDVEVALVEIDVEDGPALLAVERPDARQQPSRYWCLALAHAVPSERAVRLIKESPSFAPAISLLEKRLGLAHFEGRSYPALCHHLSIVLACAGFLTSHLPPSLPYRDRSSQSKTRKRRYKGQPPTPRS